MDELAAAQQLGDWAYAELALALNERDELRQEVARLREALVHERALCIAAESPSRYLTNAEYDAMARAELIREGLLPPD